MWLLALLPLVVFAQAPKEIVRLLRLSDSVTNVGAQKHPEDLYDKGVAQIEDTAVLVGSRNRRTNVSSFCGELASYHLKNPDDNRHDALIYRPQTPMNGATGLMVLAIPHLWFREGSETFAAPHEFTLFVCLGDTSRLGISTIKVKKDRLVKKDGYFLFVHRFAPSTGLMIRSAALILDQKWNNAFLLPKNSFSALIVQTMDVKKRKLFTGICDIKKGMNQECCRWPFYQIQRSGRRVRYHRCIGEVDHPRRTTSTHVTGSHHSVAARRNDEKVYYTTKQSVSGEPLQIRQSVSNVRAHGIWRDAD